ncbi:helix-turn-helix domain-containing protein [Pseudomonas sp. KNUC1026]|uniref:helix-turn-helix domain-containing protein n=1 Tax=Pseudomonas sp. KNUC1026 TaxID=2893890 RepID=UPI001F3B7861|nr:XRE family transcriptional regulator [Pseudomonas sp. KNUC1026]UFH50144.1 helix-turn-helix domain-containing protein [Pseudomonas sp. KNUC1026]
MGRTLDEITHTLPSARRKKIEQRTEQLIHEHASLQQLRNELGLTQEVLAQLLGMQQASVSRLEKRTDMLISTLRGYIEAMGGTLDLVARLPGKEPVLVQGIADLKTER